MKPDRAVLGIQRVLDAYRKYLPEYGVEFVDSEDKADIISAHAGEQASHINVAHCHGLYPTADEKHNNLGLFQMNKLVLDNVRNASITTVPSNWVADLFRRDMLLDPVVVPHGVEYSEFESLQQHGNHKGYVIWAKGHNAPVCDWHIVNELATKIPNVKFVSTVAEATDNVDVIGYQPYSDMKLWLAGAAVYLATTKETFGIQILEAMALGIPVVGWKWGALPDIVQHRVEGYLAEPGNIQDLVTGISWALSEHKKIGAGCIERAQQFSWKNAVGIVADVYKQLYETKDSNTVDVSIVIPCYNYEKYIGAAIFSALHQNFTGSYEVIVVNDGSTDNSESIIKQYPVRYVKQANSGVAEARNHGIRIAKGNFIACLDADDELGSDFLATLLPAIEKSKDVGIVYGNLTLKDSENQHHASKWPVPFDVLKQTSQDNCVPSCNIFRREAWLRAGGYRQQYAPAEDAELYLRMVALGYKAVMVTGNPVYTYRLHSESASRKLEERDWAYDKPWSIDVTHVPFGAAPSEWVSYPVRNYDEPWVSIIIPVGPGHENLVSRAIDSIWLQEMPYWEAIVVNDSDQRLLHANTGVPLEHAYPFIKLYNTHKAGSGPAAARNTGARAASAPFLLFVDADDGILMECLIELFAAYNKNPDCYVYSDWYSYDGKQSSIHESQEYNPLALWAQALHPITALIPKLWFDEVGGFDESLPGWEDWELFLKIAKKHCGIRVPKPLMTYDTSAGSKREKDYANAEKALAAIRAKHRSDEMCVTCRDQGRKSGPAVKSEPIQQTQQSHEGEVLVYDNSGNKGLHPVRGVKTGKQYGHKVHSEQFMMNTADQKAQPHLYVLVPSALPEVKRTFERPAPPQPAPTPPPEPAKYTEPPKQAEPAKPVEPVSNAASGNGKEEEFELDLTLLNLPQIRNLGLDKETAAVALEAEKLGSNRRGVVKYLEDLVNA
jgi:glycosyltransferase involved in cell wall biosynthesis